jgi:hypothetical protein
VQLRTKAKARIIRIDRIVSWPIGTMRACIRDHPSFQGTKRRGAEQAKKKVPKLARVAGDGALLHSQPPFKPDMTRPMEERKANRAGRNSAR